MYIDMERYHFLCSFLGHDDEDPEHSSATRHVGKPGSRESISKSGCCQDALLATTSGDRQQKIDDYLNEAVSRDEIREAAKRIQSYWRRVGEILGPKPLFESYDLDGYEEKKDGRDQAHAMLDAWAQKKDKKATRRYLIEAMDKEGHAVDAAEVFPGNFLVIDAGDYILLAIL